MANRNTPHPRLESIVLSTAARYLLPLLLLISLFILFRGHNHPGGGFVGGLVAASGFALYALAYGAAGAQQALRIAPRNLMALGLLLAAGSALLSLAFGAAFMQGVYSRVELPSIGKLSTPLLFDIGVYLVVLGVVLNIVFTFFEDQQD